MTPSLALLVGSIRQLLPLKRSLALAAMQAAPAILFIIGVSDRSPDAGFQIFVEVTVVSYFALVLPIIAIVVSSSALGVERRDQTLSFITLRPIPRWRIALMKMIAAATVASLYAVGGAVLLGFTYATRFSFDTTLILGVMGGGIVAAVAYSLLFVPLGFITDRSVIIGLALLLVFENGVVAALPGLASLSPSRTGVAAFGALAPDAQAWISGMTSRLNFGMGSVGLTLLVYGAIGVALTSYLIAKKDLA